MARELQWAVYSNIKHHKKLCDESELTGKYEK